MDESPSYVATFMKQPGRTVVDMPLSVLVALEAAARLWVWRRADERPSLIRLDPGGVLVFRGDLCHAGVGYSIENVRVHMYLYHPAYHPPRSSIYACQRGLPRQGSRCDTREQALLASLLEERGRGLRLRALVELRMRDDVRESLLHRGLRLREVAQCLRLEERFEETDYLLEGELGLENLGLLPGLVEVDLLVLGKCPLVAPLLVVLVWAVAATIARVLVMLWHDELMYWSKSTRESSVSVPV